MRSYAQEYSKKSKSDDQTTSKGEKRRAGNRAQQKKGMGENDESNYNISTGGTVVRRLGGE